MSGHQTGDSRKALAETPTDDREGHGHDCSLHTCWRDVCVCGARHNREAQEIADTAARIAALLGEHSYVVDGPPSVVGVRCGCGFRQYDDYMTPEGADRAARAHVADALADVYANANALEASLARGLAQSATGNLHDLGSFAQYADGENPNRAAHEDGA